MIAVNDSNINDLSQETVGDISMEIESMQLGEDEPNGIGLAKGMRLRVQVDNDLQGATFNYRDCSKRNYTDYFTSKEWLGIVN